MVEHESRSAEEGPGRYEFDDVVVDADNYRVLKAGQPRALAPRPFDLLLDLLRNPGRVVGKRCPSGRFVGSPLLSRGIRRCSP